MYKTLTIVAVVLAVLAFAFSVLSFGFMQDRNNDPLKHCHYVGTSGDGWNEYSCPQGTVFTRNK